VNVSRFFIDRPIFAAVLSLLITMAGALSLFVLPISEYPSVVPPTVVVRGTYPGANPQTIAETVAAPLEQQMNGVEGMLYMFSQSTSDGVMTLTVTFALGSDLDNAQVQVQNRVAQGLPRLPPEVQRVGVTTEKASPDLMMVVHLISPDERYNMLYLSNYAHLRVKDELARIGGVGSVQIFGAGEYSMRVWLDPNRLAARQLTATAPTARQAWREAAQTAAMFAFMAFLWGFWTSPTFEDFRVLLRAATFRSTSMPRGLVRRLRRNSSGSTRVSAAISSVNDSTAKVLAILPGARSGEVRSGASATQCTTAFRFAIV